MSFIFVYVTNKNKAEAKRIAAHLLKKRLVACANIFPVESLYWWKGKIEKSGEHALIAKTLEKNFEKVKREVKRLHSYDIPYIAKIKVNVNKAFEKWIRDEVR